MHALQSRNWTRSPNGVVAGVCEGLSSYNIDPNLARIGLVAFTLLGGSGIFIYLLLWWLLPQSGQEPIEPTVWIRKPGALATPPFQRTVADRKISGVCGGIARRLGIESIWLRLGVFALGVATGPLAAVAYVAATLFIPSEDSPISVDPVEF